MSVLIEQYVPVVRENGIKTNKTITVAGSAGMDMSGSTGTFKFPTGATTGLTAGLISGQGATATLTAAQSGSVVLFDRAAGITYTLPAPVVGLQFTFIITTSITSNNAKIITDAGTTLLIGQVLNAVAAGTSTTFIANGSTHIAMTQNGTTTGGLVGTCFSATCVSSTLWLIDGVILGSGTIATPFATS